MKKQSSQKINIGRFIDPLTDFGFKHLFVGGPSKELLIAFLNDVLDGRKHVVDLTYMKK